jgi:hypothetical protein
LRAFFNKNNTTIAVAARTLNDIATFYIWKDGSKDIMLSVIIANNIWVEFTSTIRARLNHIKSKANKWTYRDAMHLVPKTITKQNLEDIEIDQSILLTLLPDWERPGTGQAVMLDKLGSLCYGNTIVHKGSGSYTLPPTYPTFDPNWKI